MDNWANNSSQKTEAFTWIDQTLKHAVGSLSLSSQGRATRTVWRSALAWEVRAVLEIQ